MNELLRDLPGAVNTTLDQLFSKVILVKFSCEELWNVCMPTCFYMLCYKGTRTKALTVSLSSVGFSQVTSCTLWEMHTFTWITSSHWKLSFSENQGLSPSSESFEKLRQSMTSRPKTFRLKATILIQLLKWKWLSRVLLKALFEGNLHPGKSSLGSKGKGSGSKPVSDLLFIFH